MPPADFRGFFLGLDDARRADFAAAAGSTVSNIRSHWIHARRLPRSRGAMDRLFEACRAFGASFTRDQLIAFFYSEPPAQVGGERASGN